jgi:hypothetical protein
VAVPEPDLERITGAFLDAAAEFVVVGGFAVIANRYVRATEDVDLLVPDSRSNAARCRDALAALDGRRLRDSAPIALSMLTGAAHVRAVTAAGLVDLIREGEPPLDYDTVHSYALRANLGRGEFAVAGLRTVVAMKRLANRPRDRNDLAELEAEHGELPIDPIPGLDDQA